MIPEKTLPNGGSVPLTEVPSLSEAAFRQYIVESVRAGARVTALFGVPIDGGVRRYALLAWKTRGLLSVAASDTADRYAALTPECAQVHLFEREIAEQFGVVPEGHPWLKPVRYQKSWRPGSHAWNRPENEPIIPGSGTFYRVEGEEIHEVAVGPIHAGVIEPGHFRFQCHGEEVFHLEIALGYQHRGIEKAMETQPAKRALHYAETLCGDTTVGHATAYCQLEETLSGCRKTVRAQALRGIALELERLANHIGDLGALSGDVGFLPTASYCGRIRGDFLNMTAVLCGNRFGRGLVRPGGTGYDLNAEQVADLLARLDAGEKDATNAIELLFDTPSVLARFEGTGELPAEIGRELGIVGPAARAAGLERDVRQDHPSGIYRFAQLPLSSWDTGDAFGRAFVRWLEVKRSIAFVREQLQALPNGAVLAKGGPRKPDHLAVSLIEGWRGELCHVALTDREGAIRRYKVTDPSFHNWAGLAYVLRGQQISDFPLCNKSFNLSYCGHDL